MKYQLGYKHLLNTAQNERITILEMPDTYNFARTLTNHGQHGPNNFDHKIIQIIHLAVHAKLNFNAFKFNNRQQNSTGVLIYEWYVEVLSRVLQRLALSCYTNLHSYTSTHSKVHRDPEAKRWSIYSGVYKIGLRASITFLLTQNLGPRRTLL